MPPLRNHHRRQNVIVKYDIFLRKCFVYLLSFIVVNINLKVLYSSIDVGHRNAEGIITKIKMFSIIFS